MTKSSPPSTLRYAAVLGLLTLIGPIGIDMYLPAFPVIAEELGADRAAVQMSLVSYLIALSLGQALYGPLADRFGRRLPLLFGLSLCMAACVAAAFVQTVNTLIVLRFLQGMGSCACVVIARSIARDVSSGANLARLIAMMAIVQGLSPMLAPVLGGVILVHLSWQAIFLGTALLAAVAASTFFFTMPESLARDNRARGIRSAFAQYGNLLTDSRYFVVVLTGGLCSAGFFAYLSGSSFVLMTLYGLSPQQYGLFFGINALVMISAAQVGSRLASRVNPSRLMKSLTLCYASLALAVVVSIFLGSSREVVFIVLVVCLSCQGMIFPVNTMRALEPHARSAGAASALLGVVQYACGATSSTFVSMFENGTAYPMVLTLFSCAALACIMTWIARALPSSS